MEVSVSVFSSKDSPLPGILLTGAEADCSARPSLLEAEVTGLFDQLRNPLLRYLISLGLTSQDGDEVIQEVFLSLFQHLEQGKPRENLRGWLFRVAHNIGLKRRYASSILSPDQPSDEDLSDPDWNPEERMASLQRQERLLAVVRVLPELDRCCLHLRAEGLRYREIAKVLGISLGTVSISLQRSLSRLMRADSPRKGG